MDAGPAKRVRRRQAEVTPPHQQRQGAHEHHHLSGAEHHRQGLASQAADPGEKERRHHRYRPESVQGRERLHPTQSVDGPQQDLVGSEQILIANPVGRLRAWGVRDSVSQRALLWIDNAQHTWKNVVDGVSIQPASATLTLPGLQAGGSYTVVWWNPYASDLAEMITRSESIVAEPDGTIELFVNDLARDVALKVFDPVTSYLPMVLSGYGIPTSAIPARALGHETTRSTSDY